MTIWEFQMQLLHGGNIRFENTKTEFLCTQQNIAVYLHAAVSNDLWNDTVESQLFVEGLDALVSRVVELPGAVKVQDVPEHFGVSVEEVFLRVFVVEELLLWRAQQCVWVTIQSVLPCLEKWEERTEKIHMLLNPLENLTKYIKHLHLCLSPFYLSHMWVNKMLTTVEFEWVFCPVWVHKQNSKSNFCVTAESCLLEEFQVLIWDVFCLIIRVRVNHYRFLWSLPSQHSTLCR